MFRICFFFWGGVVWFCVINGLVLFVSGCTDSSELRTKSVEGSDLKSLSAFLISHQIP